MRYLNKIIEYGTLAFVFLVPWQARLIIKPGQINGGYWEYGTISLYATEILLLVILSALVIKGAIYIKQAKPKFDAKNLKSPAGGVLLLLIWAGLSVLWAIDREVAWERFIVLVEAGAVFLILISGIVSWKKLSWVIIISALAQALAGLGQFVSQSIPSSTLLGMARQLPETLGASVIEGVYGRWLRPYGAFPHPNILAGWLALGLILIIEQLKQHKLRVISCELRDFFLISSFVIILFGLLATFSRSAWLAFLLFSIFYFLYSLVQKRGRALAGAIIGLTAVCVFAFAVHAPEPFWARLSGAGRLEAKSNMERASSINQGRQIISQNPILGVGLGNYGLGVYKYLDANQPAWYYQPVHNVPSLIWAELGAIGVLFIAYSLLLIALRLKTYDLRLTTLYFMPFFVLSMLDHYLWSLYAGLMIAVIWLAAVYRLSRDNID